MKVVSIIAIIVSGLVAWLGMEWGILSETGLLAIEAGIFALGGANVYKASK